MVELWFATGVLMRPLDTQGETTLLHLDESFDLAAGEGTHTYEVATVTPHGTLAAASLRYITR